MSWNENKYIATNTTERTNENVSQMYDKMTMEKILYNNYKNNMDNKSDFNFNNQQQ